MEDAGGPKHGRRLKITGDKLMDVPTEVRVHRGLSDVSGMLMHVRTGRSYLIPVPDQHEQRKEPRDTVFGSRLDVYPFSEEPVEFGVPFLHERFVQRPEVLVVED